NAPIAMCGYFGGTIDFDWGAGVTNKTSNGGTDGYVLVMNDQFQLQWVNTFGGSSIYDKPLAVEVDGQNKVIVAGNINGTADMDPSANVVNISSYDATTNNGFVAKYSATGVYEWAFALPGLLPYNNEFLAISSDAGNNVYVTGHSSSFDADPSPAQYLLTCTNPRSLILLKYSDAGQLLWGTSFEQSIGNSSSGDGNSIDIDVNGNIFLGGTFYNDIDLDPSPNSTVVTHSNFTSGGMLVKYSNCNYPSSPVTVADTICQGSPLVYAATGTGTIGWYRYETGNNYLGANTITVSNTNPGNYTYWVQDSTCGAGKRSASTITVVAKPDVTLSAEFGVCDGLPAHLNATGADSYMWDIPSTGASAVDTPSAPIEIYYVIGTNLYGCADTASATVNVWPAPQPMVFATDTIVCLGQSTLLSNLNLEEDDENVWSTGQATDSITVTPVQNTDYYLAMQNGYGCYGFDTISISVSSVDVNVSLTDSVLTVAETGASFYQWGDCNTNTPIDGANSVSYAVPASGSYAVYVMNAAGCADTSECQTVDFTISGIEGINENEISVSPNPFSHQINLRIHDWGNETSIELYNTTGELVKHQIANSACYTLNVPELSSGIYLLQVRNGSKTYYQKVVKE
ncbi:MAG TPA: T9SS type A sorting domain-containing protein, partial [Chitinophagales bacterium]|nr:T9SS type A sorting domain-containing protein [Chitinophagales bacterium]